MILVRPALLFALTAVAAVPVLLACVFLAKYIFKSAEGIDGALNG